MQKNKSIPVAVLLASNSEKAALGVLSKYGRRAKDKSDLVAQLSELYMNHPDKVQVEKDFVEIHPHKEIILKHFSPSLELAEPIKDIKEVKSGCDGHCSCSKSSNFQGESNVDDIADKDKRNHQMFMERMLAGTLCIVGLIVIFKIVNPK